MDKQTEVIRFFEAAKNDEQILVALKETRNEDEAAEVAGRFGYHFTGEDILATMDVEIYAMDDAMIEDIVGGTQIDYTKDPMAYWGTPDYRRYWANYPDGGG
ncbi:MAG: Nif11-like leader peptide family natural product precursor [Gammaproteobacteria bacterium]|nr:Nif11-like leader peptide family natural product precursor [Gammaproteobacteria bacterium]